jgi:hypothetical protein
MLKDGNYFVMSIGDVAACTDIYIYIYMCVCVCVCITKLVSNEIFSPSNKIHGEVGRAKDLSAPWYIVLLRENIISKFDFWDLDKKTSKQFHVWLLECWILGSYLTPRERFRYDRSESMKQTSHLKIMYARQTNEINSVLRTHKYWVMP